MSDNPSAFDAARHMEAPFKAFLEAAQYCADMGWTVAMRPDSETEWGQQLYIIPTSSILAARKDAPHA